MPSSSVWILRASLIVLVSGAILGLLHATGVAVTAGIHADMMLLGFMIPFALGTAAWILPKKGGIRSVQIPAIVYGIGFAMLMVSATVQHQTAEVIARVTILAGVILFLIALWPRVMQIQAVVRRRVEKSST